MSKKPHSYSPIFDSPSPLSGAARAIDFYGQISSLRGRLDPHADALCIEDDWRTVGEDLFSAIWCYRPSDDDEDERQLELFD